MSDRLAQFLPYRRFWIVIGILLILFVAVAGFALWSFRGELLVGLLFSTQEAVSAPTSAPTQKAPAGPTVRRPTATPTASPTVPPPPVIRYLVWSEEYARIYLREEPGGKVLRSVPNGVLLQISELQTVDQMDWVHVIFTDGEQQIEGWMAATLVATVRSDLPLALVSGVDGAYLRAEPQGNILALLQVGTPVQLIETADIQGSTWAHVALPDERSGWIASRLLTTSIP